MKFTKQLIISIGILLIKQIAAMDNPVSDTDVSLAANACYARLEVCRDALEAYQTALASPAVDGLTQMQKAKQYLKNQIVNKKQEIAQVKVAVNFYFLADPQVSNEDKYDCLNNWRNKLEAEERLRIKLMSLKLAYGYIKLELLKQNSLQTVQEMRPYYPPFMGS